MRRKGAIVEWMDRRDGDMCVGSCCRKLPFEGSQFMVVKESARTRHFGIVAQTPEGEVEISVCALFNKLFPREVYTIMEPLRNNFIIG